MAKSKESSSTAEERRKRARKAGVEVVSSTTTQVRGHVGGFVDFIREQGVIGLAVGLAIGTAAGDTVKKLVEGFITPIVQFIVGSGDTLVNSVWHVEMFGRKADFAWGAALSSLITLIATALVIYWIINVFKLNKLDKKKK